MNPEFPFKLQAQKVTAPQLKASNLYTIYNCGKLKKKTNKTKQKKLSPSIKETQATTNFFRKHLLPRNLK